MIIKKKKKKKKTKLGAPDLTLSPEHSQEWRSIVVAVEDKVAILGEEGSENW